MTGERTETVDSAETIGPISRAFSRTAAGLLVKHIWTHDPQSKATSATRKSFGQPVAIPRLEHISNVASFATPGCSIVFQNGSEDIFVSSQRVPAEQRPAQLGRREKQKPNVHPGHSPDREGRRRPHRCFVPAPVSGYVLYALKQTAYLLCRLCGARLSVTNAIHFGKRLTIELLKLGKLSAQQN